MTPTADNLIELIKEAGVPLTIDQMMEVLPYANRKDVGALCRDLVQVGKLRTSVEDGKVAYDMADGVARIKPRASTSAPVTNLERIRQLLAEARRPLNAGEVVSGLPDIEPAAVRKALSNGSYRKLWSCTRNADGIHVWSLPEANAGSVTAVAVATATPAGAPVPAAAPAPVSPPAPPAPAPAPTAAAAKKPVTMHPGISVVVAERAERRTELGKLLDESVNNAEAAREAYVLSVVEPGLYAWLQASVRAARAARDAFAGGAQ